MKLTAFIEGFTKKASLLLLIVIGLIYTVKAGEYAMHRDSVGVETIDGKTFIIHEVEAKETLFAISRRYGAPVGDIVGSNSELKQGLKIGQRIKVPYISQTAIPEGAKLHKVAPGETLFSIARNYDVAVQDIKQWNELKGEDLSVGQGLIIQGVAQNAVQEKEEKIAETAKVVDESVAVVEKSKVAKGEVKEEKVEKVEKPAKAKSEAEKEEVNKTVERVENIPAEAEGGWISHTVAQGETLFSIAKQYEAKPEDLIKWNALSSNNLSIGQKLKVGRKGGVAVSNPSREQAATPETVGNTNASPKEGYDVKEGKATSTAYKNIHESGQAEVIQGTGNHKKYLVLHREAPVGTIMRIRNEENDVTIFARVVGKLPDTGDNEKLLIKVSQAAFDQLRAVNKKFRVEISY